MDYHIKCIITKNYVFIEHLHGLGTVLSISLHHLILTMTLKKDHDYPHFTDQWLRLTELK